MTVFYLSVAVVVLLTAAMFMLIAKHLELCAGSLIVGVSLMNAIFCCAFPAVFSLLSGLSKDDTPILSVFVVMLLLFLYLSVYAAFIVWRVVLRSPSLGLNVMNIDDTSNKEYKDTCAVGIAEMEREWTSLSVDSRWNTDTIAISEPSEAEDLREKAKEEIAEEKEGAEKVAVEEETRAEGKKELLEEVEDTRDVQEEELSESTTAIIEEQADGYAAEPQIVDEPEQDLIDEAESEPVEDVDPVDEAEPELIDDVELVDEIEQVDDVESKPADEVESVDEAESVDEVELIEAAFESLAGGDATGAAEYFYRALQCSASMETEIMIIIQLCGIYGEAGQTELALDILSGYKHKNKERLSQDDMERIEAVIENIIDTH